ncbi:SAGA-associated factor 11 homolog [Galendromus occidentalis]|uniref:SAGA-associated factor 11 n=1 Tax=Galendromus occidentalis TaxID=34638 RepID=A0AAJ7PAH6_9ACAR|nr:SAGA-associated factor 11 homolog [Galendromus occidentalis]
MPHQSVSSNGEIRSDEVLRIDDFVNEIYEDLLFWVTEGVCFELHHMSQNGILFAKEETHPYAPVDVINEPDLDIFGKQVKMYGNYETTCPCCQRTMGAVRLAPHLEKCMGMGRISSRVASRRIAITERSDEPATAEDEADDDWSWERRRKKKDRNSPGRSSRKKHRRPLKTQERKDKRTTAMMTPTTTTTVPVTTTTTAPPTKDEIIDVDSLEGNLGNLSYLDSNPDSSQATSSQMED